MNLIELHTLKAEKCRRDFSYFCKEMWESADTSTPIWNWHMDYFCQVAQNNCMRVIRGEIKKNDLIINCPPSTSKSMIFSVLLPAWLLAVKPSIRIITASYSNTIALELSTKCRNLMQSDKFKLYFPLIQLKDDENSKGNYKTVQGGGRFTTSTGSNILGMHSDIIICDDIQNLDTIYSDTQRNSVNNWVTGTLSTRKTDKLKTLTIYVQQRLHQLDMTAYLLSKGGNFEHIILPAVLTPTLQPEVLKTRYIDGYLDPIRLSQEALEDVKVNLGSKNYNAQFLQNPLDSSESIIKEEWLQIVSAEYMESLKFTDNEYFYFLDSAYGGERADNNVVMEVAVRGGNLYITNLMVSKDEFPALIFNIIKFATKGRKLFVEGKASGKSIIQQLKAQTDFTILELQPKDNKITRLNAIAPSVESKRVYIKKDSWNERLINEVTNNYPANDDIRDCFTYAVQELLIKNKNYGKYEIQ